MTYIFSVKIINLEGLVSLFFSVILPPSGQELLSDTLKKDYFHHDMSSIILINDKDQYILEYPSYVGTCRPGCNLVKPVSHFLRNLHMLGGVLQ